MSADGLTPHGKQRERWCLGALWGVPILLALVSISAEYFSFVIDAAEVVHTVNVILVLAATSTAGILYDRIGASIPRRAFHVIGFVALGLLLYAIPVLQWIAMTSRRA